MEDFIVAEEKNGYFVVKNERILNKIKEHKRFQIVRIINSEEIDKSFGYAIRNFGQGFYMERRELKCASSS